MSQPDATQSSRGRIIQNTCTECGCPISVGLCSYDCKLDNTGHVGHVEQRIYVPAETLLELAQRFEDDRREPDKILCHVQSLRRAGR